MPSAEASSSRSGKSLQPPTCVLQECSREQRPEQFIPAEEIWNDVIGADAGQPLPLPLVHRQAFRLRRRDPDRDAAYLPNVLDLHVAVAEAEKLGAFALRRCDQALDQNLLREALVVVERPKHTAIEVAVHIEQTGLLAHVDLIAAARQAEL